MKVWIIYTMMMGYPLPVNNGLEFTSETACIVYLATKHLENSPFKLKCAQK